MITKHIMWNGRLITLGADSVVVSEPSVYTITSSITHVTASSTNPTSIKEGSSITLTFTADTGWLLPSVITINGITGISGSVGVTWAYDSNTGAVTLSDPTDNIILNINGVKAYWYCIVANLGSENPSNVTFTHNITMPTLQEVIVNGNVFIKIPTMYRKVNTVVDDQITSFTISDAQIDSTYKPYPVFVKEDGTSVMDYVLMGKYFSNSDTTMNSVNTTVAQQAIANARTNARALGTGYQQYDWMFQKLWQDLLICKMNTINTNSGGLTYDQLGFYWSSNTQWVDGIAQNYRSWTFSYKPTAYVDSPTSSSVGYISASYLAPSTSRTVIQKLGYDSTNGFFNYPSAVITNLSYNTYYCDSYYYSSGNCPIRANVGYSSAESGAFHCLAYIECWSYKSMCARLCYRPI